MGGGGIACAAFRVPWPGRRYDYLASSITAFWIYIMAMRRPWRVFGRLRLFRFLSRHSVQGRRRGCRVVFLSWSPVYFLLTFPYYTSLFDVTHGLLGRKKRRSFFFLLANREPSSVQCACFGRRRF